MKVSILRKSVIKIIGIATVVLLVIIFGISFGSYGNNPVSGYCTFDNCNCTEISNSVCGKYQANVYYRIYDRKYKNYDYYFVNISVDMCPKESICYAKKFGNENMVYLLNIESFGESTLFFLLTLTMLILLILGIILSTIKSNISSLQLSNNSDTDQLPILSDK